MTTPSGTLWQSPCTAMSDEPNRIHRPTESLPVSIELLQLAEVTRRDALKAVEDWEENPPDKEYADILGATADG